MTRLRRLLAGWATALAVPLAPVAALAGAGPSLSATAHQLRKAADEPFSPVRLWDTSWWVSIQATPGGAPLDSLEYHARFTSEPDVRRRSGSLSLDGEDRNGVSGRIVVTCKTRPDYTRPVQVRVRVRDAIGATSEWSDLTFPVRGEHATTQTGPGDDVEVTTRAETERPHEPLGTVEVRVNSDTTIAEVRSALQRKALDRGGDAIVGFRLVSSSGDENTFAAEVIRSVDSPPQPAPEATPTDRVLGEIVMPGVR